MYKCCIFFMFYGSPPLPSSADIIDKNKKQSVERSKEHYLLLWAINSDSHTQCIWCVKVHVRDLSLWAARNVLCRLTNEEHIDTTVGYTVRSGEAHLNYLWHYLCV